MDNWQQLGVQPWLPWEQERAVRLTTAFAAGGLHSGVLLKGARDLGKRGFAARFAAFLICDNAGSVQGASGLFESEPNSAGQTMAACGHCASCALLAAGTHPDLHVMQPEPGKKQIGVDLVRALNETLLKTPQVAARRVSVIDAVDQLNEHAANALLKLLEEPPEHTYFILIADHLDRVLPTIRSRCQSESFGIPERGPAISYLCERYRQTEAQVEALWQKNRGFPGRVISVLDGEAVDDSLAEEFLQVLTSGQSCLSLSKKIARDNVDQFAENCLRRLAQPEGFSLDADLQMALFARVQRFRAALGANPNLTAALLAFFDDCTYLVSEQKAH